MKRQKDQIEIPHEIESILPDGEQGSWRIETFTVTEADQAVDTIRALGGSGLMGRVITPGTYKRLVSRGKFSSVMMSNTPTEIRDHYSFFSALNEMEPPGRVLIHGLGMGLVLQVALTHPRVTAVTVVEKSADIIALVGPHFDDPRLSIVHDDALERRPAKGERWEVVWHDIWPNICSENLKDMTVLHRRYARRCDWQGSWCKSLCQYYRRQEQREERRWAPFNSRFGS